jgi:Ca-activated chloride channel family protein
VDAVRAEEFINYFQYGYKEPEEGKPFSITTETGPCPWKSEHRLLHIGLRAKSIATENLPPGNFVVLIDVSGSMQPDNKLPLLKRGLSMLAENLRPQDSVAIVVYAGAAGLVLPSTPGSQKSTILDAIARLNAGGSTAGGEGIRLAYETAKGSFLKGGNNRVILATDGDFNVGVSSDSEMVRLIEKERESGIFLTVLGFGEGNLKDSKLEGLADHGNGQYAYIDSVLEARRALVEEMGGTLLTVAKDVKIQVEFNPAKVAAYRLVGYENRMLRPEDFRDDKKDAGEMGAGHTVTAICEIVPPGAELEAAVDPLKYQQTSVTPGARSSPEIATLKVRYKDPDAASSQEMTEPILDASNSLEGTTPDFRMAAAAAQFAMLLRDSKFKGTAEFDTTARLVPEAGIDDKSGRRAEFIYLVRTADELTKAANLTATVSR